MYTQCPQCNTAYRITTAQLRRGRGTVKCSKCDTQFDAISFLSDVAFEEHFSEYCDLPILPFEQALPPAVVEESQAHESTVANIPFRDRAARPGSRSSRIAWFSGIEFLLCAAIVQLSLFEGHHLVQNPDFRPWLEKLCEYAACELPGYRNPQAIDVLEKSLEAIGTSSLEFRLVMVNSGPIPQAFPRLKLVLIRLNGETLAQRVFFPEEYFSKSVTHASRMAVGKPFEITFQILNPGANLGGYQFSLI
ncbi:MAG: DUF3426 domain-containing protein [Methylococcales bacterium]